MRSIRAVVLVLVAVVTVGACGDDDDPSTVVTPSTVAETTTTVAGAELEQPSIWPSADVVFSTPEEAAEDFIAKVLRVPPLHGDFQAGDARSGEMEVYFGGEGGDAEITRGLLQLRQLGSDQGWYVIAAASEVQSITKPAAGATVTAGKVTVDGAARGFEGNVRLSAYRPGPSLELLDSTNTQAGSAADAEPFTVDLDLSGAEAGDTVVILLQGDVGLETDPGDFTAIPVLIG